MKRILTIILISTLITGCAQHVNFAGAVPNNTDTSEIRGDEPKLTIWNNSIKEPVALLQKIDDQELNIYGLGNTKSVSVKSGKRKIHVTCLLGSSALAGNQRPFDPLDNGVGNVQGPTGGISARILLVEDIAPKSVYKLKCEPIGNYRARAWLIKIDN